MLKIVGLGHSNLHAPSRALQQFAGANPGLVSQTAINMRDRRYRPTFRVVDGKPVPNPAWIAALGEQLRDGNATLYLCLGGSDYWRWSVTPGGRPFDFVVPDEEQDTPLIGEVIPFSLMQAHAKIAFARIGRYAGAIRQVTGLPLMQFLPPPPVADLAGAMRKMPLDLKKVLDEYGFSPPAFRLKMWRFCARAAREACDEAGVECVGPPADACDEGGFLRPEYSFDGVHGNTDWGRLLCRRLLPAEFFAERAA